MPSWTDIAGEVERLLGASSIAPATAANANDFLNIATRSIADCDSVSVNGYMESVLLNWTAPAIQLEILPQSFEIYSWDEGPFVVREFKHEPGNGPLGPMMELLPAR